MGRNAEEKLFWKLWKWIANRYKIIDVIIIITITNKRSLHPNIDICASISHQSVNGVSCYLPNI
jgi:hypothetical protein